MSSSPQYHHFDYYDSRYHTPTSGAQQLSGAQGAYPKLPSLHTVAASHEPFMEEPLSSFARFQIEEDLKFYATFPAARAARWNFHDTLYSHYFEGACLQCNGNFKGTSSVTPTELDTAVPAPGYYSPADPHSPKKADAATTLHPLSVLHYTYGPDYSQVSSYQYSVASSSSLVSVIQYNYEGGGHYDTQVSPQREVVVPQSHSPLAYVPHMEVNRNVSFYQPNHMALHQPHPLAYKPVVPSQQTEPPLMDHLPSPTSAASSSPHTPSTPQNFFGIQEGAYMDYIPPNEYPHSGHWPTQEQIDTQGTHGAVPPYAGGTILIASESPPLTSPRPRQPRRHSRSHIHPYSQSKSARLPVWPTPRPPSPRVRLSPLPSKRPLEKKPPLACHFCRGRKIACGPPEPGSLDKSCNQCQRRSIKCEYPLESRRGMRKKKVGVSVNTGGPKVKLGKRSRG